MSRISETEMKLNGTDKEHTMEVAYETVEHQQQVSDEKEKDQFSVKVQETETSQTPIDNDVELAAPAENDMEAETLTDNVEENGRPIIKKSRETLMAELKQYLNDDSNSSFITRNYDFFSDDDFPNYPFVYIANKMRSKPFIEPSNIIHFNHLREPCDHLPITYVSNYLTYRTRYPTSKINETLRPHPPPCPGPPSDFIQVHIERSNQRARLLYFSKLRLQKARKCCKCPNSLIYDFNKLSHPNFNSFILIIRTIGTKSKCTLLTFRFRRNDQFVCSTFAIMIHSDNIQDNFGVLGSFFHKFWKESQSLMAGVSHIPYIVCESETPYTDFIKNYNCFKNSVLFKADPDEIESLVDQGKEDDFDVSNVMSTRPSS